jgi:hypothetical protein
MRFCENHWNGMKKALEDRGLSSFIATSGETAASRVESQAETHEVKRENYEPLMGMQMAIIHNAIGTLGIETFADNPDGSDRCLLCYLIANCTCGRGDECSYYKWTDYAANDMLDLAKDLGLVGAS